MILKRKIKPFKTKCFWKKYNDPIDWENIQIVETITYWSLGEE